MLDFVGYSTAPEDAQVAVERGRYILDFIAIIPWWVLLPIVGGLTIFYFWRSWPSDSIFRKNTKSEIDFNRHQWSALSDQISRIAGELEMTRNELNQNTYRIEKVEVEFHSINQRLDDLREELKAEFKLIKNP